ncbi:MAG: type II 3-dehydroquinate dehydratase, partial [Gammaproteobacteria bacterium]|nr:type II 3-dehydroquinate dehydratase [Gammaproteobacteria bacterium]
MNIYVINGPNINLLGTREPEIYGSETLDDIEKKCIEQGLKDSHSVKFMQSNYEGEIVEWIQHAIKENIDAIVINAAAYTHTSIAIHDALKSFSGFKI